MSAHWDFVVGQASGETLTIIGDDDGLLPDSIAQLRSIQAEVGEIPIVHQPCNYFWPDFPEPDNRNTVLIRLAAESLELVSGSGYLADVAHGSQGYADGPMIYHYFIPAAVARQLSDSGRLFRRAAPNIYSSMAIAASVDRFARLGSPLTISGQGAKSNGRPSRLGLEEGNRWVAESSSETYRSRFRSKTSELMVLDSLLEVIEQFGCREIEDEVDYLLHLKLAWRELPTIRGSHARALEVGEYLRIAWRTGVAREAAGLLVAKVGSRLMRRPASLPTEHTGGPESPKWAWLRLAMPQNVADIQGAAREVQAFIDMRRSLGLAGS